METIGPLSPDGQAGVAHSAMPIVDGRFVHANERAASGGNTRLVTYRSARERGGAQRDNEDVLHDPGGTTTAWFAGAAFPGPGDLSSFRWSDSREPGVSGGSSSARFQNVFARTTSPIRS